MTLSSTLHINFRGNARKALEYYHSVFGGDIILAPYGDVPAGQGPGQADQIAWGQVSAPNGFRVMAYDVQDSKSWNPGEIPFYHSLRGSDAEEITRYWNALSEGSTIDEPLGPSQFSPLYGKLTDRFGVTWIIDVVPAY
ncbi:VOC family protein [Mycolicibacterium bacteremicum]|uniref:Bleomycin resistance protein n=1 Tax=Mycolicibacterium bacteremicum TaxID=564198 RepID=A0A1W9YWM1_MYCBA|nr:VOC family protein [Mycolicibacterium bacteremicum]MCV7431670.1 VOC family protein [Mycolicibacterium bacteremicum]ORA04486.1 bleomycin resistance protein [Mycolicibacterium bacteremicum]